MTPMNTAHDALHGLSAAFAFDTSLMHHGFTGHEQMDESGLVHMGGRVYSPGTMRFTSPDPFVQDPGDMQSFNRYSYVMNNPLTHTDPSGYWGHRQQGYLRTAAAIAITVITSGAAGKCWLPMQRRQQKLQELWRRVAQRRALCRRAI
jgi:RHS repeat-associated protein